MGISKVVGRLGQIIREKQGNHTEVLRLAEQAKTQGWTGDWDKRIERAMKKLDKI